MVSRDELLDLFATDFRRFLYDNFYSTETLSRAVTQTGEITKYLSEIELSTGVEEGSSAKIYYNIPAFNPHYGKLFFKLQFSSIQNILAFVGLKETAGDPALDMTESHAGFFFYNGNVYLSTGDGDETTPRQQRIPLTGLTPTNHLIYRIIKDKFAYYPLPLIYPYFDGIRAEKFPREWSNESQCGSVTPKNVDHYFVAFISNNVGLAKALRINFILYGEEYAD